MRAMSVWLELCKEIWWHTYIVGGAVRDFILWADSHDIDIATDIEIEDIVNRFETYDIWKNKDFGIVVVKYKWLDFEVAHFRKEWVYSDWRHPDEVELVYNIEDDLARRDFTMNAMAYDGKNIIDPFWGQEDLKKKRLRFVWDWKSRIKEDWLRVLRAYRFAAKYRLDIIDEDIMCNFDLSNISQERITQELIKVAWYGSKELAFYIHRLNLNNINFIPELQQNCEHQLKHHPEWDVYSHIVHCLSAVNHRDYLTNLCILFHDLWKFYVQKEIDNKIVYYWHDVGGAEKMYEVGNKIKLSNDEIKTISFVCRYHMVFWELYNMSKSKQLNIILDENFEYLLKTCEADELGRLYLSDVWRFRRIRDFAEGLGREYRNKKHLEDRLNGLFTGKDILELRPELAGKQIWLAKQNITELIINVWFDITRKEVLKFIKIYNA